MTKQELLILSYFEKENAKEFVDKDITPEMIELGIGSDDGSVYPFYNIIISLRNKNLIENPKNKDSQLGIIKATGNQNLYVLTNNGIAILNSHKEKEDKNIYKSEIEFQKLVKEYELIKRQLKDYNITQKHAKIAIAISIVSALVSLVSAIAAVWALKK